MSKVLTKDEMKAAFEKVFMSAPQRNPANSGVNYKSSEKKTKTKTVQE